MLVFGLSACGESKDDAAKADFVKKYDAIKAQIDRAQQEPAAPEDQDDAGPYPLGDVVQFTDDGEDLRVQAVDVADPIEVGEFDSAAMEGSRFVGIEVVIQNEGRKVYDDIPASNATLIYGPNAETDATIVTGGACDSFSGEVKVSKGSTRKGCVVFEIPARATAKVFQYSDGFGAEPGEWNLR